MIAKRTHKRLILTIITAILAILFSSCQAPSEQVPEADQSAISLEPYTVSEDAPEEGYDYLISVPLVSGHAYIAVYAFENHEADTAQVECEMSGISLKASLIDADEQATLKEAIEEERTRIVSTISPVSIESSELTEGDGTLIQVLTWNEEKDNIVYPNAAYIKADDIGDGNILCTVILADNRQTDRESADILSEVFDAYGIEFE